MEGAEPAHPLDHAADEPADALLHLARGLVGEGDGEDLPRPGLAGGEDMGEPGGEHPRLAGARARQHQDRPLGRQHRFALRFVEAGEIGGFARGRRFGSGTASPKAASSGSDQVWDMKRL